MDWELEAGRCKSSHLEWTTIRSYCGTGNYIQSPGINHNGKNIKKNIYTTITESLCCTAEIGTTLSINYTSIKKKKNLPMVMNFVKCSSSS